MTIDKLMGVLSYLPYYATIETDSGWECCSTGVNLVYYNKEKNVVVLTRKPFGNYEKYEKSEKWECLFSSDEDVSGSAITNSDF